MLPQDRFLQQRVPIVKKTGGRSGHGQGVHLDLLPNYSPKGSRYFRKVSFVQHVRYPLQGRNTRPQHPGNIPIMIDVDYKT